MVRLFTGRWGIFFYSFLAVLLCGGYEAGACIDPPDEIKLPGATFEAEKITIEASKSRQGEGRHKISFGNTVLSYTSLVCLNDGPIKECLMGSCWLHLNTQKCLSKEVADKSKGGGSYHVAIRKNGRGKEIGLVELDDKSGKLYAYSISAAGQKDPKKPYLEFHEQQVPATRNVQRYKLTVSAFDRGRLIGTYESLSDNGGSHQRGMQQKGQQMHSGGLNLRGQRVSSQGCHVDVKKM